MLSSYLLFVSLCVAAPSDSLVAQRNETTSEAILGNEIVRLRFHPAKPAKFGVFPKGYTGYSVEMAQNGEWFSMAVSDYFSAFCYRCTWGRDWLNYVIPDTVAFSRDDKSATAVFSRIQWDLDQARWEFTFTFTVRPGSPVVDVTYSAVTSGPTKLVLMWGPRLYVGQGSFGADKDEALFPGLEYLGRNERSSANPALAPDAQRWFVPTPAKITIPLMSVVYDGRMVGIMWNPMQKWVDQETCPSAVFASPNWIESKDNHLLGLFVPGTPKHVAENSLRAHTPVEVPAGGKINISAKIFATPASHAVDAIDLYIKEHGDVPQPTAKPMAPQAAVELCAKAMLALAPTSQPSGWPAEFGPDKNRPWLSPALGLIEASKHVTDDAVKNRVLEIGHTVMTSYPNRPVGGALRTGGLAKAMQAESSSAKEQLKGQQPDGSWIYQPTITDEQGLNFLYAPPWNVNIASEGTKTQGITAGELARMFSSVLITGDQTVLTAAMKGLKHMDSYPIPFVHRQPECPPSPSLHGAYYAMRCHISAYKITADKRHIERAVYWAKTGLPFIYFWTLPIEPVERVVIPGLENPRLTAEQVYSDPRRQAMLYGGLYGYGSSQFSHHWFGILVQWIPLVYANDLLTLAEYDQSLPWRTIAEGIVTSGMWLMYDKPPYSGRLPDAFNLDLWTPSGHAFAPHFMLESVLRQFYGWDWRPKTVVLHEGDKRYHVTSSCEPVDAKIADGMLSFSLSDSDWPHVRAVVTNMAGASLSVLADDVPLAESADLEAQEECWSRDQGFLFVKVKQADKPRHIQIRHETAR